MCVYLCVRAHVLGFLQGLEQLFQKKVESEARELRAGLGTLQELGACPACSADSPHRAELMSVAGQSSNCLPKNNLVGNNSINL